MTKKEIVVKQTMFSQRFEEFFEANDEDYAKFDIDLRFAFEKDPEPTFGIDRTGFF